MRTLPAISAAVAAVSLYTIYTRGGKQRQRRENARGSGAQTGGDVDAGREKTQQRAMTKAGVNGRFLKQLLALLRIVFPRLWSPEVRQPPTLQSNWSPCPPPYATPRAAIDRGLCRWSPTMQPL